MLFKYVAVGLLAAGALGATYAFNTGCSVGSSEAAETAPEVLGAEDCSACPMSSDAAVGVAAAGGVADAGPISCSDAAPSDCAESAGDCAESVAECAEIAECDEKPDCEQLCGPCESPCDSPCDTKAQRPAETTPSD